MSVSRKNKSMKKSSKSSKRSKNLKRNKKTRKNMKNMRGGGDLRWGVNQTVDFVIYCDKEVLVSKNLNVTNNTNTNFALLGTFASSGEGNLQKILITDGITNYNKSQNLDYLVPLEQKNALMLLNKKLKEKGVIINDSIINDSIFNSLQVNNTFHEITGDKRLKDTEIKNGKSCMPGNNCKIFTQLVYLKVEPDNKGLFTNDELTWKNYDSEDIFPDHKYLLKINLPKL